MTITPSSPAASQQAAVDAARLVLQSMGLSLDDLIAAPSNWKPMPTFAEYVPVVRATVTPGTLKTYGSYWNRVVEQWGDRHLDEPTASEIETLVAYVRANVVVRRNSRGGRSAAENCIAACLSYTDDSPARTHGKQGRPGIRRAPAAVPGREADHLPAVRPPVEATRRAPALGRNPACKHPLDTAYHPDLGRAPVRFRRCASVRRP